MKKSRSDYIFDAINYTVLVIIGIITVYPLLYVLSASFSSASAIIAGRVWLYPVELSLRGYKAVFENKDIVNGYLNSFYYVIVGTSINVVLTVLAAYPMSRRDFNLRKYFMAMFTFTMLFSGGMIPTYLLVKDLGLINTRWALLLPTALSVWNVIITRVFFERSIPNELLDAGKIDGCDDFRFFFKIVIPNSPAIIAVIALYYAVAHWNAFFDAFIYLSNRKYFPLQLILREILSLNQVDVAMVEGVSASEIANKEGLREVLKFSLIVVASVPVISIFPFVQKYFAEGIMLGAVKG